MLGTVQQSSLGVWSGQQDAPQQVGVPLLPTSCRAAASPAASPLIKLCQVLEEANMFNWHHVGLLLSNCQMLWQLPDNTAISFVVPPFVLSGGTIYIMKLMLVCMWTKELSPRCLIILLVRKGLTLPFGATL